MSAVDDNHRRASDGARDAALRGYLEERFRGAHVLGRWSAGLDADGSVQPVPALVRPERLADPNKGWGYDQDTSRVELARLIDAALQMSRRAALLLEDGASTRAVPWYARYGLEAPHLFVDERLVVFTTVSQRPTKAQLKDLLATGESSERMVGVVVAADDGLLDLEEEDVRADDFHALLEEPLLYFASAYEGEGFVTLAKPAPR